MVSKCHLTSIVLHRANTTPYTRDNAARFAYIHIINKLEYSLQIAYNHTNGIYLKREPAGFRAGPFTRAAVALGAAAPGRELGSRFAKVKSHNPKRPGPQATLRLLSYQKSVSFHHRSLMTGERL